VANAGFFPSMHPLTPGASALTPEAAFYPPMPGFSAYVVSKSASTMLFESVAAENPDDLVGIWTLQTTSTLTERDLTLLRIQVQLGCERAVP